jgi:hypothetical protein
MVCSNFRKVSYCSQQCQKTVWKRIKADCTASLPTFVASISKKTTTSYAVGTHIETVGDTSPLRAQILKFNPSAIGRPNGSTAENLATYSNKELGDGDSGEVRD